MKRLFILFSACLFAITACSPDKKETQQDPSAVIDTTPAGLKLKNVNDKIAANPKDVSLLHERARVLVEMKRFQEALADMQQVLAVDTTKAEYYLTMADLAFAANRTYDAKSHLEKSLSLNPGDTKAMMRLAELNLIVKHYQESVSLLNKVLESDKSNTTAWLMRGINYKENGDTARAISDFQSAIEADPDFYDAYMQLGILFQLKNDPVSEGYFTSALRIKPDSQEAFYGRALWYQDHDNLDKAIRDYTSITQLNPSHKNAHFNLGYIHQIYLKIYPEAAKHYTQAILADPRYAEAFYNRGLCLEAVGNYRDAASDFKNAVSIRPNYTLAQEGLRRVEGK